MSSLVVRLALVANFAVERVVAELAAVLVAVPAVVVHVVAVLVDEPAAELADELAVVADEQPKPFALVVSFD